MDELLVVESAGQKLRVFMPEVAAWIVSPGGEGEQWVIELVMRAREGTVTLRLTEEEAENADRSLIDYATNQGAYFQ